MYPHPVKEKKGRLKKTLNFINMSFPHNLIYRFNTIPNHHTSSDCVNIYNVNMEREQALASQHKVEEKQN
jgi:hypothetical protein